MVEAFRQGQRPETQRHTEGELPESKIFDLLSSVGNAENKALELIVMRPGVIYSKDAFYNEVMDHQKNGGWRMDRGLPLSHCQHSLSPIGLVTREAISPDGSTWGYQITEYGLRTGIPFAGILLKWSYEHPDHSLYKMFGSTPSRSIKDEQTFSKKRAQETRYKIFWEIATNPSNRIRLIDIANNINEVDTLISNHLESLNKNGVLSYHGAGPGKSFSCFKRAEAVPDKDPDPYSTAKTLTTRVWDLLSQPVQSGQSEYLSVEDTVNLLIQQYPKYRDVVKRNLNAKVADVLSNLEKQGYLQREKFSNLFQSELTVSDKQRETIVSLVTLVDRFKSGDRQTIEEGRKFAQKAANDPKLFSELMLKAKEASPFANITNREDMDAWFVSILDRQPNITRRQIQQILEKDYDKRLTLRTTNIYLLRLAKETKIIFEETKSGNVYRVAEPDVQADIPQN